MFAESFVLTEGAEKGWRRDAVRCRIGRGGLCAGADRLRPAKAVGGKGTAMPGSCGRAEACIPVGT